MHARTAAVVVLLVALPFLPAGKASAPTVVDLTILSRADGTPLAATLYDPGAVCADGGGTFGGPCPAILMAHGWGESRASVDALARGYMAAGYVVLTWDARGWGGSSVAVTGSPTGVVSLDGPLEVEDALTMVDYLGHVASVDVCLRAPAAVLPALVTGGACFAPRPNVVQQAPGDPRVGMRGESYGGGIQLLAAEADDRIDTIVPEITWHDLRTSLVPAGVVKEGYVDLLFASGMGYPHGKGVMHPDLARWWSDAHVPTSDHAELLAALAERSASKAPDALDLPVFLVQGLDDVLFTPDEARANYLAVEAAGGEPRLLLVPGGHGYAHPEAIPKANADIAAWFACYLKDACGDVAGDGTVEVWNSDADDVVFAGLPRVGDLTAGGDRAVTVATTVAPTSHTSFHQFESSSPMPSRDAPVSSALVAFDVADASGLRITGVPVLQMYLFGVTAGAAFAKLVDVAPDGSYVPVRDMVQPFRFPEHEGDNGHYVEVALPMTDHVFPAGHKVGVVLAATDDMWQTPLGTTAFTVQYTALRMI